MLSMSYLSLHLAKAYFLSARDSSILPEELATQSVRLKEEQLRREEEKVIHCLCWEICAVILTSLSQIAA